MRSWDASLQHAWRRWWLFDTCEHCLPSLPEPSSPADTRISTAPATENRKGLSAPSTPDFPQTTVRVHSKVTRTQSALPEVKQRRALLPSKAGEASRFTLQGWSPPGSSKAPKERLQLAAREIWKKTLKGPLGQQQEESKCKLLPGNRNPHSENKS